MDVKIQVSGMHNSGRTTAMNRVRATFMSAGYYVITHPTDSDGNEAISVTEYTKAPKIPTKTQEEIIQEGIRAQLRRDNPNTNISKSKPLSALDEANSVIYGDREATYGDPSKNLRTIANYWTNHLNAKYGQIAPLTPDDVCVMMVLLKQARLANSPKHRDSIVDSIGYMALADRVNNKEAHDVEVALAAKYDPPQ